MELADYISKGVHIEFELPPDSQEKTAKGSVILRGVEAGGIWIEHQSLTESFLREIGQTSPPAGFVYFLPFSRIHWIGVLGDGYSLSEEISLSGEIPFDAEAFRAAQETKE